MPVDRKIIDDQIQNVVGFEQFGTKKELKELPGLINEGEVIKGLASGLHENNTWLIVATNRRLLFLDKGMLYGLKQMEIPLSSIQSISHEVGLMFGKIKISSASGEKEVGQIDKKNVGKLAQMISDLMQSAKAPTAPSPAAASGDDAVSKLERLAALKEKGILTDEEFLDQKSKILSGE